MRGRRRYRVPRRPRIPPSAAIAPVAQHRGGNAQLAGDPAQRPTTAHQQRHRFPLELIGKMTPSLAHSTPFRSRRSLAKVSTNSRELQYRQREPDGGYRYSRWCELYRAWESRLSPTMRQAHPAGERMFVDYAGQTIDLTDGRTGEIRPAQIFVAVMGASNYTYAEATLTQSLPDWIGAHLRALAFMGGVPAQLVPDDPKVGVDRANWYEPGLNRTYLDLATH